MTRTFDQEVRETAYSRAFDLVLHDRESDRRNQMCDDLAGVLRFVGHYGFAQWYKGFGPILWGRDATWR